MISNKKKPLILKILYRLIRIFRSNQFHTFFAFLVLSFLFLLQSPTWAQEYQLGETSQFDVMQTYEDQTEIAFTLQGSNYPSVYTHGSDKVTTFGAVTLQQLAPEIMNNSREIAQNTSINPSSKQGLATVTESAMYTALYNQPNYEVGDHLASQWIPGHQEKLNTYAAVTSGYTYLQSLGIQPLWNKTLVVAYILFVVVLIVAGFMIMFRSKIGGQTAVTIYNTLPNIILGLILVTFSFAIVGFILNISVMITNLTGNFLLGMNWRSNNAVQFVDWPFSLAEDAILEASQEVTQASRPVQVGLSVAYRLGRFLNIWQPPNNAAVEDQLVAGFIPALGAIILAIAYIYASIKVFVTLFKAFFGIIIDTIFAPVLLTFSAIPGQTNIRQNWLMRVAKNAFTFPVVFFLINAPALFYTPAGFSANFRPLSRGDWNPPNTTGAWITNRLDDVLIAAAEALIPLILYFVAANAPQFLTELFPVQQSKGAQATAQGVKADLSKIPFLKRLVPKGQ